MSGQKPNPENARKVAEALLRSEVAKAVERHLPETKAQTEFSDAKLSITYADRFIAARDTPLLKFGLGPSSDDWAEVRRAAMRLQKALGALRQDGMAQMAWSAPVWWDASRPLAFESYLCAEAVKLVGQEMERRTARGPKATGKRNWQAAAVAKVAREIWAEEEWRIHPDKYGHSIVFNALYIFGLPEKDAKQAMETRREYERHVREFANTTEKLHKPGPFGRFLNDILEVLGVRGSAATALNSLRDAEEQLAGR